MKYICNMNYTALQVQDIFTEKFQYIKISVVDHVLKLTLARPAKKNAMSPQMMNEIAFVLNYAHYTKDVWVVVINAEGDVFCAGADLKAFAGEVEEHQSSIPAPNGEVLLGNIFQAIHKPCIAQVEGNVYAGGFFFLAGCHYVYGTENVALSLPEVKRGLYPFQVMLALMQVMPKRKVLDWCMRGYSMDIHEAQRLGLISEICNSENIGAQVNLLIDELKSNSPSAIRLGLLAFDKIQGQNSELQLFLKNMLQETIQTQDAKEGISAFKEKRTPNWKGE